MSTHIRLTKITKLPDRPDGDLYTLDNWQPIQVDYTIKGHYFVAPKVGERFNVVRYERNGASVLGDFSTSPVQSIEYGERVVLITTQNSVYRMEELEE
jgi:hypothetical protein